jgi:penicillin-binding protein 1A
MSEPTTGGTPVAGRRRWHWTPARYVLAAALLVTLLLWLLWQRCGVSGCPTVERLSAYQPGGESVLLDAAGEEFADLSPIDYEVVDIDSLPGYVPNAFISVEDKRFYEHHGVDARRFVGALLANIKARRVSQGFSTITMQLARNVWPERLPGQQRTLTRKILEVRVAREIERKYEKREILELYLNHIYFGDGAYGIDAAARNYFRKPAKQLTLAEAALFAAMPKSPTYYNPRRFRERSEARRNLVLSLMAGQQLIMDEEAAEARAKRVRVRRDPAPRRNEPVVAPYFVDAVRRVLENQFGEGLYSSPLRIHTTLDRRAQRAAEAQLERQLSNIERGVYGRFRGPRYDRRAEAAEETEYLQGVIVVMTSDSGAVRALVGGRDYRQSRFNRATRALRQAGSAFKPFVYATAIEAGYPPSQLISDSVLRLELRGGEVWEPRNAGGEHEGLVSLRASLVRSKNLPTIRLAREVGLDAVARLARRAGVTSEIPDLPSMAIGSGTVTPLDLTAAYTPFATLGEAIAPRFVTRVENGKGKALWRPRVTRRSVMDDETAYLVTDMLGDAVDRGTGTAVRNVGYGGVAAGKTGTTNDGADVWYVGYTPDYVASVWIGFDRPTEITARASGGRLAAPVWGRLMSQLYSGRKAARQWERPGKVRERSIDPSTGFVLIEGCSPERGRAREELFIKGTEPPARCPRGKPAPGVATVFDEFGEWLDRLWYRAGEWLDSHVGTEKPRRPRTDERYLGVPRLPRAVEVSVPELDSIVIAPFDPSLIEVPLPELDSLPPDSIGADTVELDTVPDTLRVIPPDTISAT